MTTTITLQARQYIDENNKIKRLDFMLNGRYHNNYGPAVIYYDNDGNIVGEEFFNDVGFHREGAPAWIRYFSNGNVEEQQYYINNKRHREDGPARERFESSTHVGLGRLIYKHFFINGKELSEEQFNNRNNPKPQSCADKVIEIDGVKYKLTPL